MTYQHIHLDYLNTISDGDAATRQMLLEMVSAEVRSSPRLMRKAYQAQHWEEFHSLSHKLKSTLAFVGNAQMTEANRLILSNLEEKNYQANYDQWLSVFDRLTEVVLRELEQELE